MTSQKFAETYIYAECSLSGAMHKVVGWGLNDAVLLRWSQPYNHRHPWGISMARMGCGTSYIPIDEKTKVYWVSLCSLRPINKRTTAPAVWAENGVDLRCGHALSSWTPPSILPPAASTPIPPILSRENARDAMLREVFAPGSLKPPKPISHNPHNCPLCQGSGYQPFMGRFKCMNGFCTNFSL